VAACGVRGVVTAPFVPDWIRLRPPETEATPVWGPPMYFCKMFAANSSLLPTFKLPITVAK